MQTELEAKFLDVNHDKLRRSLKQQGAICRLPMRLMHRKNFDFPDFRFQESGGWVRVRDEGDRITMSYKQLNDRGLHGTKEVNLVVSDFSEACNFLRSIGLEEKTDQETKRESWELAGVEIELDEWPWVKPYVEIEAKTEENLKKIAKLLGLNFQDAVFGSVEIVYEAEYNVTDEEIDMIPVVKFGKIPKWLEERRK